jgi:inhibitor of KinA sporulation pathway (predicted exonuclease)
MSDAFGLADNPPAYHLVIDLEATCDEHHRIPREQTEIIEIGAVLVDGETLTPIAEWQSFVRPVQHPLLTPFCTKLTSIVQSDVAEAPDFVTAIEALGAFIAGRDVLFGSWGDYDRAQLAREAAQHGVALPLGARHYNIKQAFNERVGGHKRRGVGQALSYVGLSFDGTAHRGIDDARNIARLLPYALGRAALPTRR